MASELTAQEAERVVREAWENVQISEGPFAVVVWIPLDSTDLERSIRAIGQGRNAEEAWLAAHTFTVQRQREIAEVTADIVWVAAEEWADSLNDSPSDSPSPKRILRLLHAKLTELQTGMKGAR